jgi:hypothetical protein
MDRENSLTLHTQSVMKIKKQALTVCVLSSTAKRFLATHTAVNPADRLPSGAGHTATCTEITVLFIYSFIHSFISTDINEHNEEQKNMYTTHCMKSSICNYQFWARLLLSMPSTLDAIKHLLWQPRTVEITNKKLTIWVLRVGVLGHKVEVIGAVLHIRGSLSQIQHNSHSVTQGSYRFGTKKLDFFPDDFRCGEN